MKNIITTLNFVISGFSYGGQERVLISLANYLSDRYEVCIYSNNELNSHRLINCNRINIIKYKNSIQLFNHLKNSPVMFFGFGHKILTVILLKTFAKNNSRVLLRLSDNKYERKSNGIISFLNMIISDYTLSIFDEIIVQNLEMKHLLISDYAIDAQRVKVILNPIQESYFSITPLKVANNIIFIGRLVEEKGIRDFLGLLRKLGSSITSTVIGDGPLRSYLESEISNFPFNKIEYLPYTDKIDYYLSRSSALILPSYAEGSPNVVLEACAIGIPSVVYNTKTGSSEIIIDNLNGFKVELGNEIQLYELTKKTLERDWDFRQIKNSVSQHNIKTIAQQYERILKMKL